MVAKLLKCRVVNGENNWDIFEEILLKPNLDEFYVLIIRNILHFGQMYIWTLPPAVSQIDNNQDSFIN